MSYIATKPKPEDNRRAKIAHAGTFNANPLTAAAGVAMLASVADGEAIRFVNRQAAARRHGLNEIPARPKGTWENYGGHRDRERFLGAHTPPRARTEQTRRGADRP